MQSNKFLSLLGMCRRAGRLKWGHDTCLASMREGKARLCLLSADASDRLKREFARAADSGGAPQVIETPYTMQQFKDAAGVFAGVLITEDEGFAKRLSELHQNGSRED
jgi:ribosomal protein L7Ae-like RNA K-turn-binding protein